MTRWIRNVALRYAGMLVLTAALLPAACANAATPTTLEVGAGKTYTEPSQAIAKAHDGDTVLIDPGTYFDCAEVRQNNITIAGTGKDASAVMTDKACAGKASLVIDGHNVTVKNLTLTRIRVPDGNGAGIRAEGHNLTVDGVRFINNQDGILAAPDPTGTILIRNSIFDRNGSCEHGCAHGIYVGKLKMLKIVDSTFTRTRHAHHIKSRAAFTEVIGCRISDGPDGTASYEIDIPNGGGVVVKNNIIEKGPKAENHTGAIMIGEEGVTQPTPEITIENNTFRNDGSYMTHFVVNDTATPAMLKGNKLSGNVKPLQGDGKVE